MRISCALALLLVAGVPAIAGQPTMADVDAVQDYARTNKSYSAAERARAQERAQHLAAYLKNEAKFDLEVARILALADNGHTVLFPAEWTTRYPRSLVRFGLFADGLYVIAAPASDAALIGERVETINGHPWRQLYRAFTPYQGGLQTFRDQYVGYFLESPAILAAAGLGPPDRLTVRAAGKTITVEPVMAPLEGEDGILGRPMLRDAASLVKGPLPLYLQHPDQAFSVERLADLGAAYVRLDAIRGKGLEEFLAKTLAELRRDPPRHLILDVRFSLGGDLNLARDFVQALPTIVPGRIYAITSGRTFSAAISTVGYLKQAAGNRLAIVGTPVGDRLEFWAEGEPVELPGLGAVLLAPTERHNYMTGCPEADCHSSIRNHPIRVKSLQPDLLTPLSFADFVAGRDPAMAAIEADIRRR